MNRRAARRAAGYVALPLEQVHRAARRGARGGDGGDRRDLRRHWLLHVPADQGPQRGPGRSRANRADPALHAQPVQRRTIRCGPGLGDEGGDARRSRRAGSASARSRAGDSGGALSTRWEPSTSGDGQSRSAPTLLLRAGARRAADGCSATTTPTSRTASSRSGLLKVEQAKFAEAERLISDGPADRDRHASRKSTRSSRGRRRRSERCTRHRALTPAPSRCSRSPCACTRRPGRQRPNAPRR